MVELNKYRIGTGVPMVVRLFDSGVNISWTDVQIRQLCLYNEQQRAFAGYCTEIAPDAEDDTLLHCLFPASQQHFPGVYRLIAQVTYNGNPATYDALAFVLVRNFDEAGTGTNPEPVEIGITVSALPSSVITEVLEACIRATDSSIAQEREASNAEADRVQAERGRAEAETGRVNAEGLRVEAETGRSGAEADRVQAERDRAEAETGRVNAEGLRVEAETGRSNAEADRVLAERDRAEAETGRVNAEGLRVEAEDERKAAEIIRERVADEDHQQATEDHAVVAGYNTRLTAVEEEVGALGAKLVNSQLYEEKSYSESYETTAGYTYPNLGSTFRLLKGIQYSFVITCLANENNLYIKLLQEGASGELATATLTSGTTSKSFNYTPSADINAYVVFASLDSRKVTVTVSISEILAEKVNNLAADVATIHPALAAVDRRVTELSAKTSSKYTPNYTANYYMKSDGTTGSSSTYGYFAPIELKHGETILLNNGDAMYKGSNVAVLYKTDSSGVFERSLVTGNSTNGKVSYTNESGETIYLGMSGYKTQMKYTIMTPVVSAAELSVVMGWILAESFNLVSATRDDDGNVSAANVTWPNGLSGSLTITRDSDALVTSVAATVGTDSYTLTVTRDTDGNATASNIVKN